MPEMSGWAGFSDDELRRMQQKDSAPPARGRKPAPNTRSRQQLQREKALLLAARKSLISDVPDLPPEQQLSAPAAVEQEIIPPGKVVEEKPLEAAEEITVVKELEKEEVEIREKSRLEQLQQEQKLIEERNKRKKALLAKTIAEKSKQTQAEAVKLKRIQRELQALDDMVSNEIGILRGKIEEASWEYTAARKRYEKAEAEYVAAKLELHKRTELKEQLTEHLCTIIQQNELRKARKLEELMQQLHLEATEEEVLQEEHVDGKREEEQSHVDTPAEAKEEAVQVDGSRETTEQQGDGEVQQMETEKKAVENCGGDGGGSES